MPAIEAIGLTLGILSVAGLFSTTLDAIDWFIAARSYGEDYQLLVTKVSIERLHKDSQPWKKGPKGTSSGERGARESSIIVTERADDQGDWSVGDYDSEDPLLGQETQEVIRVQVPNRDSPEGDRSVKKPKKLTPSRLRRDMMRADQNGTMRKLNEPTIQIGITVIHSQPINTRTICLSQAPSATSKDDSRHSGRIRKKGYRGSVPTQST